MKKIIKFVSDNRLILTVIFFSLLVRFYFLDKYTNVSGDLLLYADWGEKFWEYGSKNYYFVKDWYYAPPNYPPLINIYYAYADKAFDYKYLIAALHNLTKFPPAVFIIYYYKWGYYINLKLLGIICDVLIGVFIFKEVYKLLKNKYLAVLASGLYLFNPSAIILSSIWGQTDSVIALLSVLSFFLLYKRKLLLSNFLFMLGLLFKPNWVVFTPLYLAFYLLKKPNLKTMLLSALGTLGMLYLASVPFSDNPFTFYSWLIKERIAATIGASPVASVSAFNFYTVFLRIDYHLSSTRMLLVPAKWVGIFIFSAIYLFTLLRLLIKKVELYDIYNYILAIGLGSYLFMPGMLERYFFPAVIPLTIMALRNKKLLVSYLFLTLTLGSNVVWALFRRKYGNIDELFTGSNFLVIRTVSLINIIVYFYILGLLFEDNLLKLSLWKKQKAILIRHSKLLFPTLKKGLSKVLRY